MSPGASGESRADASEFDPFSNSYSAELRGPAQEVVTRGLTFQDPLPHLAEGAQSHAIGDIDATN